ncbi:MAG: undecaprenyl diphosphate synthase family protein [Oscillospiraceae bacterium]
MPELRRAGRDRPRRPRLRARLRGGERQPDELTEKELAHYLYSAGLPDPELLIRPGGEKRISNYLLWQCAYSEFYFCDTLWPDFDEREFDKALIAYQHRERRFGGVKP